MTKPKAPTEPKYTLKVWGNGAAPTKYTTIAVPQLRTMTTCDAIEFILEDKKSLWVSANNKWTLEEL